jgi:hypothetical protein
VGVTPAEGDIPGQPSEEGDASADDQNHSEEDDQSPNDDEELSEVGQARSRPSRSPARSGPGSFLRSARRR